ncbi:hypothetical protein DL98DRAFT_528790 [Cadophora sp. DSE1049]|nr:hypothetical protein DL98DRAFT_528790 [Cadophora sp. DSE1049]
MRVASSAVILTSLAIFISAALAAKSNQDAEGWYLHCEGRGAAPADFCKRTFGTKCDKRGRLSPIPTDDLIALYGLHDGDCRRSIYTGSGAMIAAKYPDILNEAADPKESPKNAILDAQEWQLTCTRGLASAARCVDVFGTSCDPDGAVFKPASENDIKHHGLKSGDCQGFTKRPAGFCRCEKKKFVQPQELKRGEAGVCPEISDSTVPPFDSLSSESVADSEPPTESHLVSRLFDPDTAGWQLTCNGDKGSVASQPNDQGIAIHSLDPKDCRGPPSRKSAFCSCQRLLQYADLTSRPPRDNAYMQYVPTTKVHTPSKGLKRGVEDLRENMESSDGYMLEDSVSKFWAGSGTPSTLLTRTRTSTRSAATGHVIFPNSDVRGLEFV